MNYKVNKGFITQNTGKQIVIFDIGKSILYTLNQTAVVIFNGLKKSLTEDEIVNKMVKKFNIDMENAKNDVKVCISELMLKEIIKKTNKDSSKPKNI